MIPKIIHYCWFGENSKPNEIIKCIDSWSKCCPDFQIIEWCEINYNLDLAPLFVKQAIKAKKWAFVTDYVRLDVVHQYGGIYMDVDVELVKGLDQFLSERCFFGIQHWRDYYDINTAVFGAEKGTTILKELMHLYENTLFVLPDGKYNTIPNTTRERNIYIAHGFNPDREGQEQYLKNGEHVFPPEYFSPLNFGFAMEKTQNTVAIHWYANSWRSEESMRYVKRSNRLNKVAYHLLGSSLYEKLREHRKRRWTFE